MRSLPLKRAVLLGVAVGGRLTAGTENEYPAGFLDGLDEEVWPTVVSEVWKTNLMGQVAYSGTTVSPACRGGTSEPNRAKAGDSIRLRYDFLGDRLSFSGNLPVELKLLCGDFKRWSERISLPPESIVRFSNSFWRLEFSYMLPLCLDDCRLRVCVESPAFRVAGKVFPEADLAFCRLSRIPGWKQPNVGSIKIIAGSPYMAVNGRPMLGLWGATGHGGGTDRLFRHSSAPLDLMTVWTKTPQFWPRDGVFDPSDFDRRAEAHLRAHPEAYLIWSLELYVPEDWAAAHPDEIAHDETGQVSHDWEGTWHYQPNFSFASEKAYRALTVTSGAEAVVRLPGESTERTYAAGEHRLVKELE